MLSKDTIGVVHFGYGARLMLGMSLVVVVVVVIVVEGRWFVVSSTANQQVALNERRRVDPLF